MNDAKSAAREVWGFRPTGALSPDNAAPGTKAFFDHAYQWRCEVEQPWLPGVVPFGEMGGKRVLEVGHGPGYDAFTLLKHGAAYSGVDITPENVVRIRQHLAFHDLTPDVREGDAENLPFADGEFDVVYSNGVLHHVPDMDRAFREALRVLKPGGRFYVLLYNRRSAAYSRVVITWLINRLKGSKVTLEQELSKVEHNGEGGAALVRVFTPSQVRGHLERAGFAVRRTRVRKLLWSDMPFTDRLGPLFRLIPAGGWDWIGKAFGWYVIAEAERPGRA